MSRPPIAGAASVPRWSKLASTTCDTGLRPLYERLGFAPTDEMAVTLADKA